MEEANNIKQFCIHLEGTFRNTGFGFSCIKKAFELKITGQLKYTSPNKVDILAQGKESQLVNFYNWCISCRETNSGKFEQSLQPKATKIHKLHDHETLILGA